MKNNLKTNLISYIITIIFAISINVTATTYFPSNQTTYNNEATGMSASNVQGAIDELYNACFPKAGEQIIEEGGLEKDPYECRYFFTGKSPNNYIAFNNELWRILSVECDGTIKIIKNESLGARVWDSSRFSTWTKPASLNTYLNETYYNSLNNNAKNQIVASNFSIGEVEYRNDDLEAQVNDENSTKWNGKIGLITASEFIRTFSNKTLCGTDELISENYFNICDRYGWLEERSDWWTLTSATMSYGNQVLYVAYGGYFHYDDMYGASSPYDIEVRPVVALSSSVVIIGGTGTQSDPYRLR